MMLLNDFIRESLENITQGVQSADGEGNYTFHLVDGLSGGKVDAIGTKVDFEVHVGIVEATTNGSNSKAKLSVLTGILGGGVEGGSEKGSELRADSYNKLKFSIYIKDEKRNKDETESWQRASTALNGF